MEYKKVNRWRCQICFEEFQRELPPIFCPFCGANKEYFFKISEKSSKNKELIDREENFLIIGSGAAGYSAAKTIREKNKNAKIKVISSENYIPYNRPQLPVYLSKETLNADMFIYPPNWYKDNNITLTLGKTVEKIKIHDKKIILEDGEELSYDKLILANGSKSHILSIKGSNKQGVFTLRDIVDVNNIKAYMKKSSDTVVIGGGLLGLEAAWQLKQNGLNVTIVELAPTLLNHQLDQDGAQILKKYVNAAGINVLFRESIKKVFGKNKVVLVKLESEKIFKTDLVLFSVGIDPSKELVENTDINSNQGIIVNEKMETSVENVYACGDVAEVNGKVYGNWSAAVEMGKIAGLNAVGVDGIFQNFVPSTIFEGMGIKLFSCGDINPDYQNFIIKDSTESFIIKLFFKDDILVGGYLINDISLSKTIETAIKKGITSAEVKNSILNGIL
ncbi:FAD-dependent oxidoreductase [Clostridium ganghwense]|uniref:FAD-dependent oxidoreductase n=1 Tax=Clostridium ganghwense TaxID=312089 RepID=A0ABT4CQJ7_9CLOT|nr:FAD-dependent oxidoreductase [Clostridium ganghwense]MCY6371333.1 FAD-dependent oxidoreductase [Clostridium ganghwense]